MSSDERSDDEHGNGNGEDAGDIAWLLARERGEPLPALTPERAAAYDKLREELASLPELSPPAGWQERVLAAIDAPKAAPVVDEVAARRARRRSPLVYAVPIAAAAAAALVWWATRPKGPPPQLAELDPIEVRHGDVVRSTEPAVGDTLVIKARLVHGELRVYRGSRVLIARCPGFHACKTSRAEGVTTYTVDVPLDAPGEYRAIVLAGKAIPDPMGRMDADLELATRAGVVVKTGAPIEVR